MGEETNNVVLVDDQGRKIEGIATLTESQSGTDAPQEPLGQTEEVTLTADVDEESLRAVTGFTKGQACPIADAIRLLEQLQKDGVEVVAFYVADINRDIFYNLNRVGIGRKDKNAFVLLDTAAPESEG